MTMARSSPFHEAARVPNVTIDIEDITASWSRPGSPFASEHMVWATGRADNGAISWHRSAESLTAPTLPAWYPEFERFLESGIRDLCLVFIHNCGWITYTSYEGRAGKDAPHSRRHVGLLPRDDAEYSEILSVLTRTALEFRRISLNKQCISVGVLQHTLSDPFRSRRVLDIEFAPLSGQQAYFEQIGSVTREYVAILQSMTRKEAVDE